MAARLFAFTFPARDPERQAGFWAGLLGWDLVDDPAGGRSVTSEGVGYRLRFVPSDVPKTVANRGHFDLTSASADDQRARVQRALELGARHIDVGQRPEEGHTVLADPEGNELCVLPAGNRFTEGCGLLGCLASDGSMQVGHFWSAALGWPLVWDQDEETATQSPEGGTKISWGGPPVEPQVRPNRPHFDLVVTDGTDVQAEVARLVSLGAKPADLDACDPSWVTLTDPDGTEFCVGAVR